jgi:hypothetical protein
VDASQADEPDVEWQMTVFEADMLTSFAGSFEPPLPHPLASFSFEIFQINPILSTSQLAQRSIGAVDILTLSIQHSKRNRPCAPCI